MTNLVNPNKKNCYWLYLTASKASLSSTDGNCMKCSVAGTYCTVHKHRHNQDRLYLWCSFLNYSSTRKQVTSVGSLTAECWLFKRTALNSFWCRQVVSECTIMTKNSNCLTLPSHNLMASVHFLTKYGLLFINSSYNANMNSKGNFLISLVLII